MTIHSALTIRSTFADDDDFRDLIEFFVEEIPSKIQELQTGVAAGDWDHVRSLAHQLKGAGGGYGFPELTNLSADLETAADERDASRVRSALDRVIDHLRRIVVG